MAKAIQIDDQDNVATVTSEVSKGEQVEVQKILTAIGRRAAELSVRHRPRIRKEFPRGNGGRPK